MTTQIFTRDKAGVSEFEVDEFTQLDVTLRLNDINTWSLTAPATPAMIALSQPGMSAVIERNGQTIVSGPVTTIERDKGTTGGSGSADIYDSFTISGVSDATALWERICYPCAPTGTPPTLFSADGHDTRTGAAETVMHAYVNANLGTGVFASGGLADRSLPGLTFAPDLGRGGTISWSARFDVLGVLLQQIAAYAGLNFDLVEDQFVVTQPNDLTADAAFDFATGNLIAISYVIDCPKGTHFIEAGGDQDVARVFVMGSDDTAAATWRRIEVFHDQRGTTDTTQLTQTLTQDISDDGQQTSLNIRPIDIPALTFGVDYQLGDLVTASVDGVDYVDAIRQVEITLDQNGEVVAPSIESPSSNGAKTALTTFAALKKLNRRVTVLERTL